MGLSPVVQPFLFHVLIRLPSPISRIPEETCSMSLFPYLESKNFLSYEEECFFLFYRSQETFFSAVSYGKYEGEFPPCSHGFLFLVRPSRLFYFCLSTDPFGCSQPREAPLLNSYFLDPDSAVCRRAE